MKGTVLLGILLLSVSSIAFGQVTFQEYVIIDDFNIGGAVVITYDSYDPPPGGLPTSVQSFRNTTIPNHIIGDERDDRLTLNTAPTGTSIWNNAVNNGYFTVSSPTFGTGITQLQYDGHDKSMNLVLNGLGAVDMTFGGLADQFHSIFGSDVATQIEFRFYSGVNIGSSSANDYCQVLVPIPGGTNTALTAVDYKILLTAVPEIGLGCEWTAISAVQVFIDMIGGCDPFIDIISSYGPVPSPTSSVSISRSVTPTISVTPSRTPSETPSPSISSSSSPTNSPTPSPSPSASSTPTISETPSPSPSSSASPSISSSSSPSPSATVTPTPSISESASPTSSPTISVTPSQTASESVTPSKTASESVTPTVTGTISETPTRSITGTQTRSVSQTNTPTVTPTPSRTASPSISESVSITATPTLSPSLSATPSITASSTRTPTVTVSISESSSLSASTTASISRSLDNSPTSSKTSSFTPSISRTQTPSRSASSSPTPTTTNTRTPSRSAGQPISSFQTFCNAQGNTDGRTGSFSIDQAFRNAWLKINPNGGCMHLATYDTQSEFDLIVESIRQAGGLASVIGGRRHSSSNYQWETGTIRGKNWVEPLDISAKRGTANCLQAFCIQGMNNVLPITDTNQVGMAVVLDQNRQNPKLVPSAGADCYTVEIALSSEIASVDGSLPLQFVQTAANFDTHQTNAINNRKYIARVSSATQTTWITDELQCGAFNVWLGYETAITGATHLRWSAGPKNGDIIQTAGSTTCAVGEYCNFPPNTQVTLNNAAVQLASGTGLWSTVVQTATGSALFQKEVCPNQNGLVPMCPTERYNGYYEYYSLSTDWDPIYMDSMTAYSQFLQGNVFYAGSGYKRPTKDGVIFPLLYFDCSCDTDSRINLPCLASPFPATCSLYSSGP